MSKPRIAIIGGGPGGLSTAFHLTRDAHWQDRIESITVYQLGWRLGGKGATGRDKTNCWRIEEHGIHGFCNFYFNTWRMMKEAYEELARSPADLAQLPTKRMDEGFRGSSSSYHVEHFASGWHSENILAPRTDGHPWDDTRTQFDWKDVIRGVVRQMLRRGRSDDPGHDDDLRAGVNEIADEGVAELLEHLDRLLRRIRAIEEGLDGTIGKTVHKGLKEAEKLPFVGTIAKAIDNAVDTLAATMTEAVADLVQGQTNALTPLLKLAKEKSLGRLYRSLTMLDLYVALFLGLAKERFWEDDFDLDRLDTEDFRAWLGRHGASREFTLTSAFLYGVPNILFAYPGGDCRNDPTLSTASWLNWTLRSLIGEGEYFYFMAAGTGETVVLPLYLLLKRRGVRFELFHKLTGTESTRQADGTLTLDKLIFERQATTVDGSLYDPLVKVDGRDSFGWPNTPRWNLLEHGAENETAKVDFEEWQAASPLGATERTLTRGAEQEGFDHVVWAIPPSMIREIDDQRMCEEWSKVTTHLTTTATQAVQLWLTKDRRGLGWEDTLTPNESGRYASAGFPNPLNAMAEFDDLLRFEGWAADGPKGLIYLCAQIPDRPKGHDRAQDLMRVRLNLEGAVGQLGFFLVRVRSAGGDGGAINADVLYDGNGGSTVGERLDYQYIRVNTRPTEAYVQAPPNNRAGRLYAWESGYANLVVAGDWIYTGLNVGAFEGAVTGGKLAAFALCGKDTRELDAIVGFDFLHPQARAAAAAALTAQTVPRIA